MNNEVSITVGGIDNQNIYGLSGGYSHTFTTTEDKHIYLEFDWILDISNTYESDEFGEAVVELDDNVVTIERLYGQGNSCTKSGNDRVVQFSNVPPGEHKITIGVYNNQKTYDNEVTSVKYDNVKISVEDPT